MTWCSPRRERREGRSEPLGLGTGSYDGGQLEGVWEIDRDRYPDSGGTSNCQLLVMGLGLERYTTVDLTVLEHFCHVLENKSI